MKQKKKWVIPLCVIGVTDGPFCRKTDGLFCRS